MSPSDFHLLLRLQLTKFTSQLHSQHRHMQLYADRYKELGIESVIFTGHAKDCVSMAPQAATNKSAPKLANFIRDEAPTIVHMFSNGGSLCWANALGHELKGMSHDILESASPTAL